MRAGKAALIWTILQKGKRRRFLVGLVFSPFAEAALKIFLLRNSQQQFCTGEEKLSRFDRGGGGKVAHSSLETIATTAGGGSGGAGAAGPRPAGGMSAPSAPPGDGVSKGSGVDIHGAVER